MFTSLPPLQAAEMPEKKKSNWKMTGPGAILVGLSIGAGEIVIWPRLAAEYGGGMIWIAVIGVFLQMWINFEVGRWTIATGETSFTGFARVWRGFAPLFIILTILGWIAPAWGRASGLALKALLVGPEWHTQVNDAGVRVPADFLGSDTFWTIITFAAAALAMFGPKMVYKSVERTIEVLIVIVVVGLLVVAIKVGNAQTWSELGSGAVNFGNVTETGWKRIELDASARETISIDLRNNIADDALIEGVRKTRQLGVDAFTDDIEVSSIANPIEGDDRPAWQLKSGYEVFTVRAVDNALLVSTPGPGVKVLFIALVFAGAGGTANLFYTFYLRDKQIGMGGLIPALTNALRGRREKVPATGYTFEDNETNASRFRSWFGFIKQDQFLFFWGLNTLTILLFIFGALAVLHPAGIVPEKGTLIYDEAQILGEVWGGTGRTIFLLVGIATLFSTQLALLDGASRSVADIVYTNFNFAQGKDVSWWYMIVAFAWIVIGCGLTWIMERNAVSDLGFMFNAAYMGGFAMAVYVPLTLYCNLRYLPRSARPGPVCLFMMIVASFVYVGFAVASLMWEFGVSIG